MTPQEITELTKSLQDAITPVIEALVAKAVSEIPYRIQQQLDLYGRESAHRMIERVIDESLDIHLTLKRK